MKKRVLLSFLILCLLFAGCASQNATRTTQPTEPAATFAWEIREGRAVIVGIGDITDAHVTIPARVFLTKSGNGYVEDAGSGTDYPVSVAGDAFADCDTIKSITFSEGVAVENDIMNAGETGMFAGCDALVAVYDIPRSVHTMTRTFENCGALTEVNRLPESLKSMRQCFQGCSALTTPPEIPSGVIDMTGTFKGCSALGATPALPKTVRQLTECFRDCTALTEVSSIQAVATDYTLTFAGCTALTQLPDLPDRVSGLDECFRECTALTAVTALPESTISMNSTFYGCTALESFTAVLPASVTRMDSTFEKCTGLKEFTANLPRGLTSAVYTFRGCVALESMTAVPAEVVALQDRTFMQCNALKHLDVETCPNTDTSEVFLAMTTLDITYLGDHELQGLCRFCNRATGTYQVGKLKVYFQDVPAQVFEDAMACLENEIPAKLRDANYCLAIVPDAYWVSFLQDFCDYLNQKYDSTWASNGGLNITKNRVSYSAVRVFDNYRDGMGIIEWDEQELRGAAHELGHGYDWGKNPPATKKSQSRAWIKLHKAEGETIRRKYYSESQYMALAEYDRREETFAMAIEGYFGNPAWLQEHCPGMYEYMEELWKDA